MSHSNPRNTARLKQALLIGALLAAVTAAAVYVGYRWLTAAPSKTEAEPPADTGMTLERIHQTATREGRTEWSLDAATARYLLAEKKVVLSGLSVVYFLKNGQKVYMTADRGEVLTDSNDMDAAGNVVVYNDLYRVETERASYRHGPRLMEARTPVRITGKPGELTSDTLALDLNTNRSTLRGHVQGNLLMEDTSKAPIHIWAEELQVDLNADTAEFCGDVLVTQENARLDADRLTIHYTRSESKTAIPAGDLSAGTITKLVASGRVVIQQDASTATAEEAVYEPADARVVLSGPQAVVTGPEATLRGDRMIYYRNSGQLTVESRPPQRVTLTLRPAPSRR
jgi:lipopolysaccharide export system protein LptA